jgi:hypothetical protein
LASFRKNTWFGIRLRFIDGNPPQAQALHISSSAARLPFCAGVAADIPVAS